MKTTGLTFPVQVMRVTEVLGAMPRDEAILGNAIVRSRFSVRITPVIETGETHRDYFPCGCVKATAKNVDTFKHWEFEVRHRGWRRWFPDKALRAVLDHHCAVELWTKNEPTIPDPDHPWIHWLFPSTSWLRAGRGWKGRSYGEAAKVPVADFPEGQADVPNGGFWKTATPPPA